MIRSRSGQELVRAGVQQKDTLSSMNKGGRVKVRVDKCKEQTTQSPGVSQSVGFLLSAVKSRRRTRIWRRRAVTDI